MQKVVLITGCSSGFGLHLTKALLKANWRVIATVRNIKRSIELNQLQHPALTVLPLDVTSQEDVQNIVLFFQEKLNGQLDCLINNAGFGLTGAFEELALSQMRDQMEVNLWGVIMLTQKLLPFLRQNQGRIINISSILGYLGMPIQSLYVTSKFALEGLSESLYYELSSHQVQVAIVEPGVHQTAFGKNMQWGKIDNELPAYQAQRERYQASRDQISKQLSGPPERVTQCILKLLKKKRMPLRVRVGPDAKLIFWIKKVLPEGLFTFLMRVVYQHKS